MSNRACCSCTAATCFGVLHTTAWSDVLPPFHMGGGVRARLLFLQIEHTHTHTKYRSRVCHHPVRVFICVQQVNTKTQTPTTHYLLFLCLIPNKSQSSNIGKIFDGGTGGNFLHNASHVLENVRGRRGATLVLVGLSAGVPREGACPPRGPQTKLFRLFWVARRVTSSSFVAVRRTWRAVVGLLLLLCCCT